MYESALLALHANVTEFSSVKILLLFTPYDDKHSSFTVTLSVCLINDGSFKLGQQFIQ